MEKKIRLTYVSDFFINWGVVAWIAVFIVFNLVWQDTMAEEIARMIAYLMLIFGVATNFLARNDEIRNPETIPCIIYSDAHFKPDANGFKKIVLHFPIAGIPRSHEIIQIRHPYKKGEQLKLKTTRIEHIHDFGKLQHVIISCL